MGITLIYVVSDFYRRANSLDTKLEDDEFLPMIYDETTKI
jgi:hypothetical protein